MIDALTKFRREFVANSGLTRERAAILRRTVPEALKSHRNNTVRSRTLASIYGANVAKILAAEPDQDLQELRKQNFQLRPEINLRRRQRNAFLGFANDIATRYREAFSQIDRDREAVDQRGGLGPRPKPPEVKGLEEKKAELVARQEACAALIELKLAEPELFELDASTHPKDLKLKRALIAGAELSKILDLDLDTRIINLDQEIIDAELRLRSESERTKLEELARTEKKIQARISKQWIAVQDKVIADRPEYLKFVTDLEEHLELLAIAQTISDRNDLLDAIDDLILDSDPNFIQVYSRHNKEFKLPERNWIPASYEALCAAYGDDALENLALLRKWLVKQDATAVQRHNFPNLLQTAGWNVERNIVARSVSYSMSFGGQVHKLGKAIQQFDQARMLAALDKVLGPEQAERNDLQAGSGSLTGADRVAARAARRKQRQAQSEKMTNIIGTVEAFNAGPDLKLSHEFKAQLAERYRSLAQIFADLKQVLAVEKANLLI